MEGPMNFGIKVRWCEIKTFGALNAPLVPKKGWKTLDGRKKIQ